MRYAAEGFKYIQVCNKSPVFLSYLSKAFLFYKFWINFDYFLLLLKLSVKSKCLRYFHQECMKKTSEFLFKYFHLFPFFEININTWCYQKRNLITSNRLSLYEILYRDFFIFLSTKYIWSTTYGFPPCDTVYFIKWWGVFYNAKNFIEKRFHYFLSNFYVFTSADSK